MSTIELSVTSLPLEPAPYEEWRSAWSDYLSAYDKIFKAEPYAVQQVEANPADEEETENPIFARVAGCLLVELLTDVRFSRRDTVRLS